MTFLVCTRVCMLEAHKSELSHDVSSSLSVAYVRKFDLQHDKYEGYSSSVIHCVLISGT